MFSFDGVDHCAPEQPAAVIFYPSPGTALPLCKNSPNAIRSFLEPGAALTPLTPAHFEVALSCSRTHERHQQPPLNPLPAAFFLPPLSSPSLLSPSSTQPSLPLSLPVSVFPSCDVCKCGGGWGAQKRGHAVAWHGRGRREGRGAVCLCASECSCLLS